MPGRVETYGVGSGSGVRIANQSVAMPATQVWRGVVPRSSISMVAA